MKGIVHYIFVSFILIALYAFSYTYLQNVRSIGADKNINEPDLLSNLSPTAVSFLAGEFKGLFASYITLDIAARLGTRIVRSPNGTYAKIERKKDWKQIHRLVLLSQYLDPAFQQTYYLAQGWLPWDAKMVSETQEILQTAAKARPWDWQPHHFQGFNTYYFLNDPGKAGEILLQASLIKDAPQFLAILGARLASKGNKTETAIILLESLLINKSESDADYQQIYERLHALRGIAVLEKAVETYRRTHNKLPASLDELVQEKILKSLPENPYKVPYCINTAGKIFFDNPHCDQR